MDSVGRKGRQTHGDVFRAGSARGAVTHPLTGIDDDCLAGGDLMHGIARLHLQLAAQDDCDLVEFRPLTVLTPPWWAGHFGDAERGCSGIHTSDEFLDDFRRLTCRRHDRGCREDSCHTKNYTQKLRRAIEFLLLSRL